VKRTSLSLASAMIFLALFAHAQTPPPPQADQTVTPPNKDVSAPNPAGDADPLSVIEPKKEPPPPAPTVPQFTEIPTEGAPAAAEAVPAATAPPQAEAAAPAPKKHSKKSKKAKATEVAESVPSGSSEPDMNRENRFHEIYQRYNSQPTPAEAWEKAIGRAAQVYKVQKGDTLWSISNTFFGDSNYWPKIWALNNGSILNPHEINPDMVINFYPGNAAEAPTLGLASGEAPAKEEVEVKTPDGATVEIKRRRAIVPVLKSLPPSLPTFRIGLDRSRIKPQIELQPFTYPKASVYLSYFLADAPQQGVGKVVETEMGLGSAGEYQYIYVQLNDPSAKTFTVEKNLDMLKDPHNVSKQAAMIEVQGEIQVGEKVNAEKNIYRALITKNINPLQVGSFLVPGKIPLIDPDPSSNVSQVGAMIIGGQNARERFLFGPDSIIFLNAGSGQGLQVGQTLQIYADQRLRNSSTSALINDRSVGVAKIVKVTPEFATAYISHSNSDIMVGDYIGHFAKQAEAKPEIDTTGSSAGEVIPAAAPGTGDNSDLEL